MHVALNLITFAPKCQRYKWKKSSYWPCWEYFTNTLLFHFERYNQLEYWMLEDELLEPTHSTLKQAEENCSSSTTNKYNQSCIVNLYNNHNDGEYIYV